MYEDMLGSHNKQLQELNQTHCLSVSAVRDEKEREKVKALKELRDSHNQELSKI